MERGVLLQNPMVFHLKKILTGHILSSKSFFFATNHMVSSSHSQFSTSLVCRSSLGTQSHIFFLMQISLIFPIALAPNMKVPTLTEDEDIVCPQQTEDPPVTMVILFRRVVKKDKKNFFYHYNRENSLI